LHAAGAARNRHRIANAATDAPSSEEHIAHADVAAAHPHRRARSPFRVRGGVRHGALTAVLLTLALAALGATVPPAPAQAVRLRVVANGQDVTRAADAILQNGIVMAPFQGLFAPLGIRAAWDPRALVLTLTSPAGDQMQLRPNDPYATVNGERRPIPIPLVSVLGRVLIPLQWVFETLGDAVAYDASAHTVVISPQVTSVYWRVSHAGLEVTLAGTAPLHTQATALDDPDRLVIDVAGAVLASGPQTLDVHAGPVTTIRLTQSPSRARVQLDLVAPTPYRLQAAGDRRVVITLSPNVQAPGAAGAPSTYTPSAQKIMDVRYEHVDGGGRVVIVATQPVHATQHVLRNPDRLVLDVPDAVFIPVKKTIDVNDGLIVQVRAAQFHKDPNIVRIVVQLSQPAPYTVRAGADPTQALVAIGATAAAGPVVTSAPGAPAASGPIVALDAGHGGSDPGAIGPSGLREKDVTLAIAEDVQTLLAQQHFGVIMVRESDVFVPLDDRARIAAQAGATLLVSIHANASVDANANGTQTFYYTPQSVPLAQAVLDELSKATGLAPRGVTQARFAVLVESRIPAILVETAFITNPREEHLLGDPAAQQMFAQGIARGIVQYLAATAAPQ
jgi:N-acetylmuramoyl-L-alanine amidase